MNSPYNGGFEKDDADDEKDKTQRQRQRQRQKTQMMILIPHVMEKLIKMMPMMKKTKHKDDDFNSPCNGGVDLARPV